MKFEDFQKEIRDDIGIMPKRVDVMYNTYDCRCWTAAVGNMFVTFIRNRLNYGTKEFDVISPTGFVQTGVPLWDIRETIQSLM